MKKACSLLFICLLVLCLTACAPNDTQPTSESHTTGSGTILAENENNVSSAKNNTSDKTEEQNTMEQHTFYVTIEKNVFSATFADTVGAQALKNLLQEGPITINLRDYGGFEKVGALGQSLPTDNAQTTTQAGDIVLYQGNQMVLFYGSNSWSYTRLGKINDLSGWRDALGGGNVNVTFSLSNTQEQ